MSRTTTSYAQAFVSECSRVADLAFRAMTSPDGTGCAFYLYFKPHKMLLGIFREDADPRAEGWVLARSERIPSDRTRDQLAGLFHDIAFRLPILPE